MQGVEILDHASLQVLVAEMKLKLPFASPKRQEEIKANLERLAHDGTKWELMCIVHDGNGITVEDGLEMPYVWETGDSHLTTKNGTHIVHLQRWYMVVPTSIKDNWGNDIWVNFINKQPFVIKRTPGNLETLGTMHIGAPVI